MNREAHEEIRKEISECLANARQACKDNKGTYEYDRLHDFLRAECYQAKKLRHLADAALLKEENPQQAEAHFRKAFGKSGFKWVQKTKLLAARKILTDLYESSPGRPRSYPEAARLILAIRPAVANLANETQILNLRKKFDNVRFRTENEFANDVWEWFWEEAPRDWVPIDLACYFILSIKLPR